MQLMFSLHSLIFKVPKNDRRFEANVINLPGADIGAFWRNGQCGHNIGMPRKKMYVLCGPVHDADLIPHCINHIILIRVSFETVECRAWQNKFIFNIK